MQLTWRINFNAKSTLYVYINYVQAAEQAFKILLNTLTESTMASCF